MKDIASSKEQRTIHVRHFGGVEVTTGCKEKERDERR